MKFLLTFAALELSAIIIFFPMVGWALGLLCAAFVALAVGQAVLTAGGRLLFATMTNEARRW